MFFADSVQGGESILNDDAGVAHRRSVKGILGFLFSARISDAIVQALEKLGITVTSKHSQCTHLLAPNLVRTEKFLCALANAPVILDPSWAIKSANQKTLLRALPLPACCYLFMKRL
jgi:hypothetical protein